MKVDHLLEKDRFGAYNVFQSLSRHRIGKKADEIAGMAGLEGDADLAVGLEAADPWPMAGARVDNDEGTSHRIDRDGLGRNDPCKHVIDRPVERATVNHQFGFIVENIRSLLGEVLLVLIAPLPQHVPEQDGSLAGINQIFEGGSERTQA